MKILGIKNTNNDLNVLVKLKTDDNKKAINLYATLLRVDVKGAEFQTKRLKYVCLLISENVFLMFSVSLVVI